MNLTKSDQRRRRMLSHKKLTISHAPFWHDGSSISAWAAVRLLTVGPDGMLNWDKLDRMGVYRGHLKDSLASSSNGGATVHAYGVKAMYPEIVENGVKTILNEEQCTRVKQKLYSSHNLAGTRKVAYSDLERTELVSLAMKLQENEILRIKEQLAIQIFSAQKLIKRILKQVKYICHII